MNTKLNKSDFIVLGIYFLVNFLMNGKNYYQRGAYLREYLIDFPVELVTTTSIIFIYIFWLTPKFIVSKKYFLFGLYGVFVLVFFAGIEHGVGYWTGDNDWSNFPRGFDYIADMIDRGSTQTSFPFAILLTKKFYEGKTEMLELEKQQKESELKILRSQIDPHFLFNNLNTLDSLIDSDSEKAKEYINRLSLIYRYLIQTKDSEVMELSEEIQLAENYIFLIQTRFGNDYEFNIERETEIVDKFIPTGAIQTLLENVVKHNKPKETPIKTTILIEDDWLKVENSKSNLKVKKESFGTGLANLKTRYKLLSDKEISVINTDTEFKVVIPIIKLSV